MAGNKSKEQNLLIPSLGGEGIRVLVNREGF